MQPKPQRYDVLASRYWDVCLVNALVESGRLLAGFAYFEGGIGDRIEVYPPNQPEIRFAIAIPEAAQRSQTCLVMTSAQDSLTIPLAAQPL